MPIPEPKKDESKQEFMNRCMSELEGENKPSKQKVAICLNKFREKENGEKKEKLG